MSLNANAQNGKAIIDFNETEFDFGKIQELEGAVHHRFIFVNKGDIPLIISSVKTSCGCTSPKWSKEPVLPQKEGYIDVTFDPRDRPGSFTKSITVTSNDLNFGTNLYISGTVIERNDNIAGQYPYKYFDLRMSSTSINFSNVYKEKKATSQINIYNPSKADLLVEFPKKNRPEGIEISSEKISLKPSEQKTVKFTYNCSASKVWDYVSFEIPMTVNTYDYSLHARAFICETFTDKQKQNPPRAVFVKGNSWNFGTISKGETVIYNIEVKNTGTSSLIFRAVRNSSSNVSVKLPEIEIEPGKTGIIEIAFDSESSKGLINKYITFITNCPEKDYQTMIYKLEGNVATDN